MAKKTRTALDNALREGQITRIMGILAECGEETLRVAGNVIAFPTVDEDGNDSWIEITVKVPKGERIPKDEGGGFAGYDGYEMAEFYTQESTRKADEAKKRKETAEAAKAKKDSKKNSKPTTKPETTEAPEPEVESDEQEEIGSEEGED